MHLADHFYPKQRTVYSGSTYNPWLSLDLFLNWLKCVVKDQMTFRQCNDGDQRSAGGKDNPEPSLHALILTCHNQFTVRSVVEDPPTPSHKPATHATLHRNPHGFKFYFHTASTTSFVSW